jgi:hypothetical protein
MPLDKADVEQAIVGCLCANDPHLRSMLVEVQSSKFRMRAPADPLPSPIPDPIDPPDNPDVPVREPDPDPDIPGQM